MNAWDKQGLIEFKRKVSRGKIFLDSDPSKDDITKMKEILDYVLMWLAELKRKRIKRK